MSGKRKLFDLCCGECGTAFLVGITEKEIKAGVKSFYDSSTFQTTTVIEIHVARHGIELARSTYSYLTFFPTGYVLKEP